MNPWPGRGVLVTLFAVTVAGCFGLGKSGGGDDGFHCSNPAPDREGGCACTVTASRNLVPSCSPATIQVSAGATPLCCRDYVVVGTVRKAYQCVCVPVVCVAGETSCACFRADGSSSAPTGTPVSTCDGFAAATPGTICCSHGSGCSCGTSACGSFDHQVASCSPALTCDPVDGEYEPVDVCQ